MKWLLVFIGGGFGSLSRFALSLLFSKAAYVFPWATLTANAVAASLLAVFYAADVKYQQGNYWQFAAIGFCGGLSTFSTFSMETVQLLRGNQWMMACGNVVLSVTLSLVLFYVISLWIQRA